METSVAGFTVHSELNRMKLIHDKNAAGRLEKDECIKVKVAFPLFISPSFPTWSTSKQIKTLLSVLPSVILLVNPKG